MGRLLEVAEKYICKKYPEGTDKGEHGYLPLYEKYLPDTVNNFMEIGVWNGDGLRMFRDFYGGIGNFYAVDYMFGDGTEGKPVAAKQLLSEGFLAFEGGQSDLQFLSRLLAMDVIVEDASHHSDEQVITFNYLFRNKLNSGGLYVLEDLKCCNDKFWWRDRINSFEDTALSLFRGFLKGEQLTSQYISQQENDELMKLIDRMYLYEDEGIAFIFKK